MIEYHFNNEHQKFNRIVSGVFFGGRGGGGFALIMTDIAFSRCQRPG